MLRLLGPLLAGGLFGAGLLVSGMTDPARVRGWLDIAGDWDPTLGFVLTGALLPMALAWRVAARRVRALDGAPLPGPATRSIDARLILGAALFGLGWGVAGLCPGPAMASLGFGGAGIWTFALAMCAGMIAVRAVARKAGPDAA